MTFEKQEKLCKSLLGILIPALLLLAICVIGGLEDYYNRCTKVVDIQDNIVIVEDPANHTWQFSEDGLGQEFEIGDTVILGMRSGAVVDSVKDDVILSVNNVKYEGNLVAYVGK